MVSGHVDARARPPARRIRAVLAGLTLWAAAYQVVCAAFPHAVASAPFNGFFPDSVFACAAALLIWRRERPWVLIGLGSLCWVAGDVYWTVNLQTLSSPPVPSWADAGYLLFCPFTFTGILLLVRRRSGTAPRTLLADAAAAALAAAALSAAVVVQPVLSHAHGGLAPIATNLAYPVNDLILLAMIVAAVALGCWRLDATWVLLLGAVLSFWVADSAYLTAVATGTYQNTSWYNPLWYASPVLSAWAAWTAPRAALSAVVPQRETARGITMLLGFAALALGILVWSSFSALGALAIALAAASLVVVMGRLVLTWRENLRLLNDSRDEAITDQLTGLRNRRALVLDLGRAVAAATVERPVVLVLLDLNGFKQYNDSFGHPAGDVLLQRLGGNLGAALSDDATAYRMGGDEFCALIRLPREGMEAELPARLHRIAASLSEQGEGFAVDASLGAVVIPDEAVDAESALRIADRRMYAHKQGERASTSEQTGAVLLSAMAERDPRLRTHLRDVGELAGATAARFGLGEPELEMIRRAAELHDVGKVAIPDAILDKPAALDEREWAFIRRHTLIGERIVGAAPSLVRIGRLVRWSHENWDGSGYPDGLAGEEIPLGARIISVCDAFDAMTTDRPYRAALPAAAAIAELRRCAGTQFDPAVVREFCAAHAERHRLLVQAA